MAQARRIKPKKSKAKRASGKSLKERGAKLNLNLPWGLMLVIGVSCVILGMLFNGAKSTDTTFGSGLRQLFENSDRDDEDREIAELIEKKSSKKEFEFYELLPEIEKVMPDDLPESKPARAITNYDYYLQAASFKVRADAEKLRARLALKGYKSITQAREVAGKGTYYRVRLGPYKNKRKAKTAKNKLQKIGVRPFVYSVKKD